MPDNHIKYGFFFALLAYAIFPQIGLIGIIFIFLSSVLIDIDHYFAFVLSGHGFDLQKAFKWYLNKNKTKKDYIDSWVIIFHGFEIFIILWSLYFLLDGIFSNLMLYIIIGFIFHILLDCYMLIKNKQPIYLKLSFLYTSYLHYNFLKYNIKPKYLKSKRFK